MKEYNKLVRDKIPSIIEANHEKCNCRVLDDEEYLRELNTKLKEELNEYLESGEIEELADMAEVMKAILDCKSCDYLEFENIRKNKVEKRGAFKDKIFLISTEDNKKFH